jgi:membrane protein
VATTAARTRRNASQLVDRVRPIASAFKEHKLSAHTGAIAFRVLVALVPLVLLGLAMLGALGLEDVWTDSLAPSVQERVSPPVFTAIDYSVEKIFRSGSAGLIALASLLLFWELSRAVRAVMVALNVIHDVEESRSATRLLAATLGLALAIGLALVGSVLAVTVFPRLGVEGPLHALLTVFAWLVAAMLLALAVALLVRYAPAEHPSPSWASAGSVLIVGTWIVASLLFGWWAGSVANYESAVGSLTVFLFLTAYVLVSSAIFLIGVELDELGRRGERKH